MARIRRREAADPIDRREVEAAAELRAADAADAGAARRRRAGASSRAGSSSCCCRWRCSAPWALAARGRAGRCCCSSIAGADRAAAQPVRDAAAAARASRAGSRCAPCILVLLASLVGHRRPARQPGRRPGRRRSSDNVPGHRRRRQRRRSPTCRTGSTDNGIDVQVKEQGQTALQTLGEQRRRAARASSSSFTRDALQRLVEASIALILILVLSVYMLLYGERIGAVVRARRAAGRRHAGGRLPDAGPARGVRLRARPAAVLADHGHERRASCCGSSARSGSSPTARRTRSFFGAFYGFAELIPYIGPAIGALPPVLIALFSDDPLDAVWLAIAFTRCSRSRATSSRRRCSAQALRINPLLVIFALLLGGQLYGIIGAFIALPIAAIAARDGRLPAPPPRARAVGPAARPPGRARRAPATARRAAARSAAPPWRRGAPRCPACGTELRRRRDADGRDRGRPPAPSRSSAAREGVVEALRRRGARCATSPSTAAPRRAGRDHRPQRRRQDDAAADPRRRAAAERAARVVARRRRRSAGCRSSRRSTRSSRWPRTCACSRAWRRSPTSTPPSTRMLEQTGPARPRRRRGRQALGRQPPAREHRDRPARASRRCCCSTSRPSSLDPRQRERLWDVRRRARRGAAPRSSTRPTTSARPSATPTACSCWPTASCCSRARPRELEQRRRRRRRARLRGRVRRASSTSGVTERALAAAQGPADPAPLAAAGRAAGRSTRSSIALLIGARALRAARASRRSRSPTSCRRAERGRSSAASKLDAAEYARRAVRDGRPDPRRHARGGDREGALRRGARRARDPGRRRPSGCRARSASAAASRPTVEVYYNAEDPLKRRFVERRSASRLAEANDGALGRGAASESAELPRRDRHRRQGRAAARRRASTSSACATRATIIDGRARRAAEGLAASASRSSRSALRAARRRQPRRLASRSSPRSASRCRSSRPSSAAHARRSTRSRSAVAVTVSLMFVALLLAAGMLALEREEHAFGRLVRGLVSPHGAAGREGRARRRCARSSLTLVMLVRPRGVRRARLGRVPLWLVALAVGALAFAAHGRGDRRRSRARCAPRRCWRSCSSLPVAFLALVPSGAVERRALRRDHGRLRRCSRSSRRCEALDAAINGGALARRRCCTSLGADARLRRRSRGSRCAASR